MNYSRFTLSVSLLSLLLIYSFSQQQSLEKIPIDPISEWNKIDEETEDYFN